MIEGIIRTFLHIRQIKANKWGKIDFSKKTKEVIKRHFYAFDRVNLVKKGKKRFYKVKESKFFLISKNLI